MTRRVIIAIVINVWLVLITAGCSTYFITRSLLLADLDLTIVNKVASLPGIERSNAKPLSTPDAQDRFVIQDKAGRRVTSLATTPTDLGPPPVILSRIFTTLDDGTRLRTLTLKAYARDENPAGPPEPVTVVYSAPSAHVDALLRSLLYSFSFFGILAAVASAAAARSAARAALRPMRETAELIGNIDERSLNRRVDVAKLPPELAPVGTKINQMLGRLETAFAQRREFLANASHELRTPVAALVTALEVALRRKRDSGEYLRVLEQSLADARLLNQLVVTLIEQARWERFGENPEFGPVLVPALLRGCLETIGPLAESKGLAVETQLGENLTVFTDETMLRSAVINLLSNAVEYTPEKGTVVVSAAFLEPAGAMPEALRKAVPEELTGAGNNGRGKPGRLAIAVRDNGPGIAAEHLPNIFEPFFRADQARTYSKHHLGLGLAAVRTGIRALGGDCRVDSPPGEGGTGCVFRIELPTIGLLADKMDGNEAEKAMGAVGGMV